METQARSPGLLCPSILSADFARLADESAAVQEGGADMLHVDVMDGHFVPNLTLGAPVVRALKKVTQLPLDCHLMVSNPDALLEDFAAAGADLLSVHVEACPHLHRTVQRVRALGMRPGVAVNPHTAFACVEPILTEVDFVLVMSVNPGFGGQSFIPEVLRKVSQIDQWRATHGSPLCIQIDGGINAATITQARDAGVDWFVAGSAVFGAQDRSAALAKLRALI